MKQALVRVGLILLFIYTVVLGGGFWGILLPATRLFSLLLLAILVVVWLVVRTRDHWRWHATALDVAFPLWALVFVVSLMANPESARRSLLAMWYMGLYAGLWYILQDALANRGVARRTLIDAVVLSGVILMLFTIREVPLVAERFGVGGDVYRLQSIIGNANTFAIFLVVMLMCVAGLILAASSWGARLALAILWMLAAGMLLLTFSRSAWLGAAGALVTWVILLIWQGTFSWSFLRAWRVRAARWLPLIAAGVGLGVLAVGAAVVIRLGEGRLLSGRPELFGVASNMFQENPLVGRGLFSFGRYAGRVMSQPPEAIQAHAHSLPVNLAGELGLAGLVVAALTVYLILRTLRRPAADSSERALITAAGAASVGFGIGHIFDIASVLPSIAITGLLALVAMTAPVAPQIVQRRRWLPGRGVLVVGLWGVLFAAGAWDIAIYNRYFDMLSSVGRDTHYGQMAEALQSVADADPMLVVYPAQQAYLWGLAAHDGDTGARSKALAAYDRAIALEPYYAPYYANQAALYWADGQRAQAIEKMQAAVALASGSWQLQYNLGLYAEQVGAEDVARAAYTQALAAQPDADLHPDWGQTPLQTELRSAFEDHSPEAREALLIEAGRYDEALDLWQAELTILGPNHTVLREIMALAQGDRADAGRWYELAARATYGQEIEMWKLLGEARLVRYDGDDEEVARVQSEIDDRLTYSPQVTDYDQGNNIAIFQYYRQGIPRQFLPEVFYPTTNPLLLHLLAQT